MLPWHASDATDDDVAATAAHNNAMDVVWWSAASVNVAVILHFAFLPHVQDVYHNLRYDDSYRRVFPVFCRGLAFIALSYAAYTFLDEAWSFVTQWLHRTLWHLIATVGAHYTINAVTLYNTTYDRNMRLQEDARRDEERWMKRVTRSDARLVARSRGG
jgi:hypothetical protein